MNQREAVSQFIQDTKVKMNPQLFERSDEEVMDKLTKSIRSCARKGAYFSIEVLGFDVVDDFDEINKILFDYYERAYRNKTKAKRKDNRYGFINLNESDIRLLIIHYRIADKDQSQNLDVIVAVPRIVDKYYFKIDGIMRSTLYQVVDGSTYNNSTSNSKNPSVTMKIIFMACRVFRRYMDLPTEDNLVIRATYYTAFAFNKTVGAMKYILGRYGFMGSMNFLGIQDVYILNHPSENPDFYNFKKSDNLYVVCPRQLFDSDLITQSFVASVYNSIHPEININEYYNDKFWVRSLGMDFNKMTPEKMEKFIEIFNSEDRTMISDTYDKGLSILNSFEGIYDECIHEITRLDECNKADMYCILRWMLREYNMLRLKDNLDISVKRIRFAEYIATLYAMKIARGIYRIADMNKRATIESIIRAIRTDPMYLLGAIVKSKMVSYRNMVSDMDSMQGLKYTYKGVSGLGEGGNKSIPDIYRTVQPSHIGHVDIDASSDGNPGITGTLNPFMKMGSDGYFSDYQEPNTWPETYNCLIKEYNSARKMRDVMTFQTQLLGIDNSEKIEVYGETIANMEQIINPIAIQLQEGLIYEE